MALSNEWTKRPAPSVAREELNRMYAEAELKSLERMYKRLRRERARDMWFMRGVLIFEALLLLFEVYLFTRNIVNGDWGWAIAAGVFALVIGALIWMLWRQYWRRQVEADESTARENEKLAQLRAAAGVTQ